MDNWKKNHVQIAIDELNLDIKNPRTDNGQKNISENSVIKELLEENVLDLAKDIAENGYLAVSTLMVVEENNKKIVIDGNRRLLAAKILHNPDIIKKYISAVRFKGMQRISDAKVDDVSFLTGIVYPKRKNAEHEMAILHLTGIAIQQWKPLRQYRYFQKRLRDDELSIEGLSELIKVPKSTIKKGTKTYQLYEIARDKVPSLKNSDGESIYSDKNFKTDKFQRAILNEEGERFLGYYFSEEDQEIKIKDDGLFLDRLEKVLIELYDQRSVYFASAQFPVTNRTEFFKKIDDRFLDKKSYRESQERQKEIEESGQNSLFESTTSRQDTSDATCEVFIKERSDKNPSGLFIASNVPFKLKNSSVNILYKELKKICVRDFPNATHDLLRSFLECSMAEYLTQIGEYSKVQKSDRHTPKLGEMITHVINNKVIDDQHILDNLANIKSDWDAPYSLERMNKVNHNKDYASSEGDVRVAWAKLESFFKEILNPKKTKI